MTQPSVHLLTRAQKPYVASHEPAPPPIRPRGWPRQYGAPVKLTEVFSTYPSQFCTAILPIYGKVETVSDLALNLLWKPLKGPVRFVFAITKRGPIVLMTSDLGLDPLTALSLYCARVRIETMFAMLKGVVGAFLYHLSLLAEALAPPFSQTDQKYHSQKTVHSRSPPRPPYLASL